MTTSINVVARHLNGHRGILQVDGYAAYNKLARSDGGNDGVTLAGCWSHSRREFYELHAGKSPAARVATRQQTPAVVVPDLYALWQKTLPRVSGKSKLAKALRYAISRRAIFERFLTDGRIELDSNIVERTIRPQATARKTPSSPVATAGDEPRQPSRRCCRKRR